LRKKHSVWCIIRYQFKFLHWV